MATAMVTIGSATSGVMVVEELLPARPSARRASLAGHPQSPLLRSVPMAIRVHRTSPRCSLQLMDMLPGGQMNFPPRARQAVQTFAADQVHQCATR